MTPRAIDSTRASRPSTGAYVIRLMWTSVCGPSEMRVSSFSVTPRRPSAPVLSRSDSNTTAPSEAGIDFCWRTITALPETTLTRPAPASCADSTEVPAAQSSSVQTPVMTRRSWNEDLVGIVDLVALAGRRSLDGPRTPGCVWTSRTDGQPRRPRPPEVEPGAGASG